MQFVLHIISFFTPSKGQSLGSKVDSPIAYCFTTKPLFTTPTRTHAHTKLLGILDTLIILSIFMFPQAMLNPDYRQRPIAEAALSHRFMTGSVL